MRGVAGRGRRMLQMQRFCCELPSAPVHQIHAKSIRCYCVVLNLELHRICHGHHLAVKCIGKFYNSADCAIVPGTEARALYAQRAQCAVCTRSGHDKYIFTGEPNDRQDKYYNFPMCGRIASRRRRFLPTVGCTASSVRRRL